MGAARGTAGGLGAAVLAAAALGAYLGAAGRAGAVDPFYENLLAKGTDQYNRGLFAEAARTLRVACFGFLEEPVRLADCLVRLGLAQGAAGQGEAFAESFRRLAEVEERFGGYSRAELPAAVRAEYQRYLRTLLPPSSWQGTRGFAPPGTPSPGPTPGPPVPGRGGGGLAEGGAAPAGEAAELEQAAALLREGKVAEAFARAAALAEARPTWVEAQLVAAEAAYRLARWQEAVRYFSRAGDPGEERPLLLFYWAVSLYEAGERARAAEVLRRALPRIRRTDYVAGYEAKILGPR